MTGRGLIGRVLGFSIVSVVSAIVSIIVVPVSTHLYTIEELGRINFFFAVVSVLFTAFCLGLDQGYVRFYSLVDPGGRRSLLTFNVLTCCLALLVGAAIGVVMQDPLSEWLFGESNGWAVPWLLATLTCLVVLRFVSLKYRMESNVLHYTLFAGAASLVQKGVYVFAALVSRTYVVSLHFVSIVCVVSLIVVMILERRSFGPPHARRNWVTYQEELRFAAPLLLSSCLVLVSSYAPQFVIKERLGFSYLSVYIAAVTVSMAIQLVQSGFNVFWAPFVYQHYETHERQIRRVHEGVVIVSVLGCMMLALASDAVFLVFSSGYSEGARLVPFLMLAPMCYTIGETTGIGVTLRMKAKLVTLISGVTLVASVLGSLVLVPLLGLRGAAIAVGVTGLMNLVLRTELGGRLYRSFETRTFMAKGVVMYLLVCVVSLTLADRFLLKTFVESCCVVVVCVLFGREKLGWAASRILSILPTRRKPA